MQAQIKAIIEEHLPSQTAGVMKEFIEKAEATEDELDIANGLIKKQMKIIADFEKQEEKFKQLTTWESTLKLQADGNSNRSFELDARERQFELELNNAKLESMGANMKNMENLVNKVFGHPSVTITGRVPVASGDYNAQGQYGGGEIMEDTTETTTEGKV